MYARKVNGYYILELVLSGVNRTFTQHSVYARKVNGYYILELVLSGVNRTFTQHSVYARKVNGYYILELVRYVQVLILPHPSLVPRLPDFFGQSALKA